MDQSQCMECTSRGDPRYCDVCRMMWELYGDNNNDNDNTNEGESYEQNNSN